MVDQAISIRIADTEVQRLLSKLERRAGDLRPILREIGEDQLLSIDENFRNQSDPDGNPWPPLSPGTIARKKAQGRILKILQNTGRLRASINLRVDRDQAIIGTNVKYGAKHQLGQDGLEIRRFMGASTQDSRRMRLQLDRYLINRVTEAGSR